MSLMSLAFVGPQGLWGECGYSLGKTYNTCFFYQLFTMVTRGGIKKILT